MLLNFQVRHKIDSSFFKGAVLFVVLLWGIWFATSLLPEAVLETALKIQN